jgi:hypothetical protein
VRLSARTDDLPGAIIRGSRDTLTVYHLCPQKALIAEPRDPGERQACICVRTSLFWRAPGGEVAMLSTLLLECADHAAGRYLQLRPDGDLGAALFEAAAVFAGADAEPLLAACAAPMYLRTAGGAFAAHLILGKVEDGPQVFYARARTWLRADMLSAFQAPPVLAPDPGRTIAAMILKHARPDDELPAAAEQPLSVIELPRPAVRPTLDAEGRGRLFGLA